MTDQSVIPQEYKLLFDKGNKRGLHKSISCLGREALLSAYNALKRDAPRRSAKRPYFSDKRNGRKKGSRSTNRREEHVAIALWNLQHEWSRRGSRWRLLDYQTPLKAMQASKRVGKIDLLGRTAEGRLMIIELKIVRNNGRMDSPLTALMEGLRYAAMVEGDREGVAAAVESFFRLPVSRVPPVVQLLAPKDWWQEWFDARAAGQWAPAMALLAAEIEAETHLSIEFMALDGVELADPYPDEKPTLTQIPTVHEVFLTETPHFGPAL